MPLIMRRDAYQRWLDPAERETQDFSDLLSPFPATEMEAFPVARTVNSVKNDSADCVQQVPEEKGLFDSFI